MHSNCQPIAMQHNCVRPLVSGHSHSSENEVVPQGYSTPNEIKISNEGCSIPNQVKISNQGCSTPNEIKISMDGYSTPNEIKISMEGCSSPNEITMSKQGCKLPSENMISNNGCKEPLGIKVTNEGCSQPNETSISNKGCSQSSESKISIDGQSQPNESKIFNDGHSQPIESKIFNSGHSQPIESKIFNSGHSQPIESKIFNDGHSQPIESKMFNDGHSQPIEHKMFNDGHSQLNELKTSSVGHSQPNEHRVSNKGCSQQVESEDEFQGYKPQIEVNDTYVHVTQGYSQLKTVHNCCQLSLIANQIEIHCPEICKAKNAQYNSLFSNINNTKRDIDFIQSQVLAEISDPKDVHSHDQIPFAQNCNMISENCNVREIEALRSDISERETIVESVICDITYSNDHLYLDRLFSEQARNLTPVKESGLILKPEIQSRKIHKGHAVRQMISMTQFKDQISNMNKNTLHLCSYSELFPRISCHRQLTFHAEKATLVYVCQKLCQRVSGKSFSKQPCLLSMTKYRICDNSLVEYRPD